MLSSDAGWRHIRAASGAMSVSIEQLSRMGTSLDVLIVAPALVPG